MNPGCSSKKIIGRAFSPFGKMVVLKVSITVQKSKLSDKQDLYRLPNYLPILQTSFQLQMKVVILNSNKNILHGKSGG